MTDNAGIIRNVRCSPLIQMRTSWRVIGLIGLTTAHIPAKQIARDRRNPALTKSAHPFLFSICWLIARDFSQQHFDKRAYVHSCHIWISTTRSLVRSRAHLTASSIYLWNYILEIILLYLLLYYHSINKGIVNSFLRLFVDQLFRNLPFQSIKITQDGQVENGLDKIADQITIEGRLCKRNNGT